MLMCAIEQRKCLSNTVKSSSEGGASSFRRPSCYFNYRLTVFHLFTHYGFISCIYTFFFDAEKSLEKWN